MSDSNKDSDWAFPLGANEWGGHGPVHGMTLRDYFAAKAMMGAVSACSGEQFAANLIERCTKNDAGIVGTIAEDAYSLADAMILERAKCQK